MQIINMKKKLFLLILIFFNFSLFAQEALTSLQDDYYDFLSLQGIAERPFLGYKTLNNNVWDSDLNENQIWQNLNLGKSKDITEKISYKLYALDWFNSYNTELPYGQNDGALFQGAGYNTSFTTGIQFNLYGFSLTFKPQLCFSQNNDFYILPTLTPSGFGDYSSTSLDLPQRFGPDPYFTFDFGDSEVRYSYKSFTVGFGTQHVWLGPAYLNPKLGSNNAPTYPKFDIGLNKLSLYWPKSNFWLGDIEGRFSLGWTTESAYFDNNPDNNQNLIYLFNFNYRPFFLENLTLGATKVCLIKKIDFSFKYFNPFYNNNSLDSHGEDQKASIYFDLLLPLYNLDIYGEIGVDDYTSDKLSNPFHTWVYTAGFKKKFNHFTKIQTELIAEINQNEMSQDFQIQWCYPGYYSHHQITQGYTQKGQCLGAGSGYHGNSQFFKYQIYYNKGKCALVVHRHVPDINHILNIGVNTNASEDTLNNYYSQYRTYMTIALEDTHFITSKLSLGSQLGFNYTHNYDYVHDHEFVNWHLVLQGNYIF